MAEQLWGECPLPPPHTEEVGAMWRYAKGHKCRSKSELPAVFWARVPVGALLIEDGLEAATGRMWVPLARILSDALDPCFGAETRASSVWRQEALEELLRAAVGGQPKGRGIGCWPPLAAAEGREA